MNVVVFFCVFVVSVWKKFSLKSHPRRPQYLRVPEVTLMIWNHSWLSLDSMKEHLVGQYFWCQEPNLKNRSLMLEDFDVYLFMGIKNGKFFFWNCSDSSLAKTIPKEITSDAQTTRKLSISGNCLANTIVRCQSL